MITVHASTITAVPTNNGLGTLVPTSCVVTQEINGEYELEMTHPRDEYGKWERLVNKNILYVPTPDGTQLFRIYRTKKNINGDIEVNARHIFYDLSHNIIEYLDIGTDAGEAAIDAILGATQYSTTFTGSSDIATVSGAVYVRKNPVQILLGNDDNGWLKKWGGEIQRDNFSIAMNASIGADNSRVVAYKKNLTGVDAQEEDSNVVTRIMPTGLNSDDTVLYLDPSKYVDSALIGSYPHPRIKHVHFADVKVGKEVDGVVLYATQAAARAELENRADALIALGCDRPEVSIDIEFRELGDTEEYQQYIQLSTIQLGDTITVQHEDLGIDLDLRAISYEWDALRGRHNKIRLGDKRPNIGQSVVDIDIDISSLREDYSNAVKQGETYNAVKIDHTDGFAATATIGGVPVRARFNASEIGFYDGSNNFVGGMARLNGALALIAKILTSGISATVYATIGSAVVSVPGFGNLNADGIFLYDTDESTTDPVFSIMTAGTDLYFLNPDGTLWMYKNSNGIKITNYAYNSDLTLYNTYAELSFGTGMYDAIGVDATGPYKIKNGSKTYL